ncbi:MAG: hypothetical protein ABFR62_00795 [Bacteroidota bacterium]
MKKSLLFLLLVSWGLNAQNKSVSKDNISYTLNKVVSRIDRLQIHINEQGSSCDFGWELEVINSYHKRLQNQINKYKSCCFYKNRKAELTEISEKISYTEHLLEANKQNTETLTIKTLYNELTELKTLIYSHKYYERKL